MLAFARALPHVRALAAKHVKLDGMPRDRVLACAIRLLDRGFFRIGGEDYAEQNQTYGIATMQKRHVAVGKGGLITFDYEAKGGKHQITSIVDPHACEVISELKRRRSGRELLAYKPKGRWVDVRSADINSYIKEVTGADFSAKTSAPGTPPCSRPSGSPCRAGLPARRRPANGQSRERSRRVSHYLGNTPTVCRASYIDPRVFDRFEDGVTIGGALDRLGDESRFGEALDAGRHRGGRSRPPRGRRLGRARERRLDG